MAQLSRQHAELSTMVSFMSDEVAEEVNEVSWKVLPGGGWNVAATRRAEPDEFDHAFTAAFKGARQLGWQYFAGVNSARNRNAVTPANHFDPHAPGVVNMSCERTHSPTR